ncbi:hypothetical protein B0H14DRAFT_3007576 [Mycena olivaceomarginata]|nr:hypothetical protein B0H14DRAFT_3007576 [Mycena olivaceomarginata]
MAKKSNALKPKRHHGYAVLLFILGTLFPPLAVAARFGIGGDFWLNLLLTICGYIPGHGHNFYIQNIRNNKTHARTPKWAQRYGLVDTSEIKRKERKSQWQSRYNDRLPQSTLDGAPYEEGGRWHYPANFDDAAAPSKSSKKKKKGDKKDRWARTEDAYSISEEQAQRRRAAEGGLYGDRAAAPGEPREPARQTTTDDVFNHEF